MTKLNNFLKYTDLKILPVGRGYLRIISSILCVFDNRVTRQGAKYLKIWANISWISSNQKNVMKLLLSASVIDEKFSSSFFSFLCTIFLCKIRGEFFHDEISHFYEQYIMFFSAEAYLWFFFDMATFALIWSFISDRDLGEGRKGCNRFRQDSPRPRWYVVDLTNHFNNFHAMKWNLNASWSEKKVTRQKNYETKLAPVW